MTHQESSEDQLEEPRHLDVLAGSTPVIFRGQFPTARVATVGINPSVREFLSRRDVEWQGEQRRFETLSSLGVRSMADVSGQMAERIRHRCLGYFEANPYMEWFAPLETLLRAVAGASYFDGSACHLDLVQWATQPLWGQLDRRVRTELLARDRAVVTSQMGSSHLQILYLNGSTVCDEVGTFIPLTSRPAHFRGQGPQRRFFRGFHGHTLVVGCSSNLQEERLRTEDRNEFMAWVIEECRHDIESLREAPPGA